MTIVTSTRAKILIKVMTTEKGCTDQLRSSQTVLSVLNVSRRFVRAHRSRGPRHSNICPERLQPFFSGGPTISLFLPFLVFFPNTNHHYLDKLLTLPEKLNYINNFTMKILSPSEKCTAANKNLPDFHQATWARAIVMYDCVVLPEILSSVHSLLYMCICMPV